MDEFEEFRKLYTIVITTFASVLTAVLLDRFKDKISSKGFLTMFTVVLVSIILAVLNYGVERIIDKSTSVRQWIDPDNYIEGYYYDITIINGAIDHAAMIKISYDNGEFSMTGETISLDGKHIATFRSQTAIYKDRTLFLTFESYGENGINPVLQGIDQLQFGIPPNSYSGFYMSYDGKLNPIVGYKVGPEELEMYHSFSSLKDKQAFLTARMNERARQLPARSDSIPRTTDSTTQAH